MEFSFEDYQQRLHTGLFQPPDTFRPYVNVMPDAYREMDRKHEVNGLKVDTAFRELERRTGRDYFSKVYPVQTETLDWAQLSFPAYRFILAEVLQDDWLATVDWHKHNRDHALHQPLTAYITLKMLTGAGGCPWIIGGVSLLDRCVDEIQRWEKTDYLKRFLKSNDPGNSRLPDNLFSDSNDVLTREIWKALFVESAFLAATFHDSGYPWQYVSRLNSKLSHAGFLKESPTADAEKLLKDFGRRLLFCPLNGYKCIGYNAPSTWKSRLIEQTKAGLRETHGFPGAIGFLYLNDVLRDYPEGESALREFCVEWAAMAVMMHDMKKVYWGRGGTSTSPENKHLQLKFDVDPLSCVVALADVLQDFERPNAKFYHPPNNCDNHEFKVCLEYNHEVEKIILDYNTAGSVLEIKYKCAEADFVSTKDVYLNGDRHDYFDLRNGYLDLSACGIERVELIAFA